MLLEVFDKETRTRQGFIQKHSFVQYTERYIDLGEFSVTVPRTEKVLPQLTTGAYILFDVGVMGIVKYVQITTDESSTITVRGSLLNDVLSYRAFLKTSVYSGDAATVARSMVSDLLISNSDPRRNIPYVELSDDPKYIPTLPNVSLQNTGGKLSDVLGTLLDTVNCGYELSPRIVKYDPLDDSPTNIEAFEFRVLKSVDRTIGNPDENTPVTFSFDLNNLARFIYERDDREYRSTAIVAGEGEGQNRVTVETGDIVAEGIDRIELYVDARDLQRETESGMIPLEQYEIILKQRGDEYLTDHKSFTSVDGTITSGNTKYTYKKDFFKGDFVSIVDSDLNLHVNAQITAVTKSLTDAGEIIDVVFGYERSSIKNLIGKRGII